MPRSASRITQGVVSSETRKPMSRKRSEKNMRPKQRVSIPGGDHDSKACACRAEFYKFHKHARRALRAKHLRNRDFQPVSARFCRRPAALQFRENPPAAASNHTSHESHLERVDL